MVVFASLVRMNFTNFYAHDAFSKELACFDGTLKCVKYILPKMHFFRAKVIIRGV